MTTSEEKPQEEKLSLMEVLNKTPLTGEFHIDQESCNRLHTIVRKQIMDEISNDGMDIVDLSKVIANSWDYITIANVILHGLTDLLENHRYREINGDGFVMSINEEKALERLRLCQTILGLK